MQAPDDQRNDELHYNILQRADHLQEPCSPTPPCNHSPSQALDMASPAPPSPATLVFKTAERKLHIHLLPFMFALVTLSFIDRTNLAFASLQMNPELGFSSTTYGWGSGVFFLGYAAFQIPSNLFLTRVGPPRWLASITLLWGVCASGFALIRNAWQFLLLRFLLGTWEVVLGGMHAASPVHGKRIMPIHHGVSEWCSSTCASASASAPRVTYRTPALTS